MLNKSYTKCSHIHFHLPLFTAIIAIIIAISVNTHSHRQQQHHYHHHLSSSTVATILPSPLPPTIDSMPQTITIFIPLRPKTISPWLLVSRKYNIILPHFHLPGSLQTQKYQNRLHGMDLWWCKRIEKNSIL